MDASENLYNALVEDFGMEGATGSVRFNLRDFGITVEQNNIIGNILEEWLDKWMTSKGIVHIHNYKQASPDFWLDPDNLESNWLEIKSFTGSPNFDIAAFRSFINLVIEKPWKLHSKHLLIKYKMENGVVEIERIWLIVNIRPATWYSERTDFKPFDSLEDFLAAMEETIYQYPDTRVTIALHWKDRLIESYERHYGVHLNIPRWNDIADKYANESAK